MTEYKERSLNQELGEEMSPRSSYNGFPEPPDPRNRLLSEVDSHLKDLGFSKNGKGYFVEDMTKQKVRDLHAAQRLERLGQNQRFIEEHGAELITKFAQGKDICPRSLNPTLVEVKPGSPEARLFRFATLLWSIPVSQGFGRRIRYLVMDDRGDGREFLMGLFALGDPVFNLSARDNWIGWTHEDRRERLVHVMDAYVVGAVPPYSQLIGGKLIAALMTSKEVRKVYERKYLGREAVISKKNNKARLVLLTTTSALGRSSIYNRLTIPGGAKFTRLGLTKGFGHFHLSGAIFDALRDHLAEQGHPYASGHRFGMGPNWKIRVVRTALEDLGIDGNSILKHGIGREVYAIPLAENWKKILLGENKNVRSISMSAEDISDYCVSRWMQPRAERDERYKSFETNSIMKALLNGGPGPSW